MNERDKHELGLFKTYLDRLGQWDRDNTPSVITTGSTALDEFNRLRLQAQFDIYQEIYGERP